MHWRITEDLLVDGTYITESRVGYSHSDAGENGIFSAVEVRLLDDDREHYYTAICEDSDESLWDLYSWAQADAGVTILQMFNKKTGQWEDEI